MDLGAVSDRELEERLRELAADGFNAALEIDKGRDQSWRARCMVNTDLGPANVFSVEGAASRRAALVALWRSFEVKAELDEWNRRRP
jgi:hypothetical protein